MRDEVVRDEVVRGEVVRGEVAPGGVVPITDEQARLLVHRAGGTPLYAYSRAAMGETVRRVRAASPRNVDVYYSLKANPHVGVVNRLSALVDGFDVCSLNEMETALNVGMPPERLLFTGPAKSRQEAAAALAAAVAVTIESPGQACLFADVARELGVAGRAVVRPNTPYPGRTAGVTASPNQFGVAADDLADVVRVLRASPLSVTGLHLFWGSHYFDADIILAAREAAVERAWALAARFDLVLDFVAIGGGIALPWRDADPDIDWRELQAERPEWPSPPGGAATVACEYGRSIVGPAGTLLTTVLDTKTVGDRRYVLVDAGMNHLLTASRLLSGSGRGEPPVRAVSPRNPSVTGRAWVTGPLCSQLDVLAENVLLPEVDPGDMLCFLDVGAYGPTFSPSGFLSRDGAKEIVF
jgi:diaminopimelate decarboxylase